MITLRPAAERGTTDLGWLDSRHTFSFGDYFDPAHVHFRTLRVINDDKVAPATGFGTHPHRDMEILTWVLDGTLEHKDSMGNGSRIRPGELQRMTAGTGVTHSELNPSRDEGVRLLQIWILPEGKGLVPGYEQKAFPLGDRKGRLALLASQDGRDGSVRLNQDADVWGAVLVPGESATHVLRPGRGAWLQVARGELSVNGVALREGDGAAIEGEESLLLTGRHEAELLLFDLA